MPKRPAVYIMANGKNGALYTGVTSNLVRRIYEHREGILPGFSKKYDCKRLIYYEHLPDMKSAIHREKQIKSGSRAKKLVIIESMNRYWRDLFEDLC